MSRPFYHFFWFLSAKTLDEIDSPFLFGLKIHIDEIAVKDIDAYFKGISDYLSRLNADSPIVKIGQDEHHISIPNDKVKLFGYFIPDIHTLQCAKENWQYLKSLDQFNVVLDFYNFGLILYNPMVKDRLTMKINLSPRRWKLGLFRGVSLNYL